MTEEEKAAFQAMLDANNEKVIQELGVNSPEFFAKHEAFMAECNRVQEEMRKERMRYAETEG